MLNLDVMSCFKFNSSLKSISGSIACYITLTISIFSMYMNQSVVFVHACDFVHDLLNFIRTGKQLVVLDPL